MKMQHVQNKLPSKRLLLVVDDDITQEELLSQLSHNFSSLRRKKSAPKNSKVGKTKWSAMFSVVSDNSDHSKQLASHTSSSTPQASHSTPVQFECRTGVLRKIHGGDQMNYSSSDDDDEDCDNKTENKNGSNSLRRVDMRNGKRTKAMTEIDDLPKMKRRRKKSCDFLKEKLRESISDQVVHSGDRLDHTTNGPSWREESQATYSDNNAETASSKKHSSKIIKRKVDKTNNCDKFSTIQNVPNCHRQGKIIHTETSCKARTTKQPKIVDSNHSDKNCDSIISDGTASEGPSLSSELVVTNGCSVSAVEAVAVTNGNVRVHERTTVTSACLDLQVKSEDDSSLPLDIFDEDRVSECGQQALSPVCDTSCDGASTNNLHIPDSLYVAVDCEMVGTGPKGKNSVLARCSIVDYNGKVIYDQYIRPSEEITDYRTPWSGIRPSHMKTATPLVYAIRDIHECLAHKVVIGHAVYNDFRVLGIRPDYHSVRDTAQCKMLVDMAGLAGRGNSLKKLSQLLLDRQIQHSKGGHCSVEDARATLDLFKLVRSSWEPQLYAKWSRKDKGFESKMVRFIEEGQRHVETGCAEDFLHDKFWPDEVIC